MSISRIIVSEAHLKCVGLVAAEWSYVEMALEQLIWHVADIDNERGYCITSHINSETRINILESLADKRLPSPQLKARLKQAVADLRTLRTERNNIVHSIWLTHGEPNLTLGPQRGRKRTAQLVKVTAKGKLKITSTPYPTKKIAGIAEKITQLLLSMQGLLTDMRKERDDRLALAEALRATPSLARAQSPTTKELPAQRIPSRA